MVGPLLLLLAHATAPKLMVHVMPWFAAKPASPAWGWHWTMGKTDAAKGDLASHYRPLLGAYDSNDPDLVVFQSLLIKVSGFDGMLVDWYGDLDRYDYLPNHRATTKLFEEAKKTGLSFALVYEDQTVPNLISGGLFEKANAVNAGNQLFRRAEQTWFHSPTYQKLNGQPLLLVFGPQFYKEDEWPKLFEGLSPQPAFFTVHLRKGPAIGAFDWPLPGEGWQTRRAEVAERAKAWSTWIPVAFPRFNDYYKAAGVSAGYGPIEDESGKTYDETLSEAIDRVQPFVQVATWNDWGEGTQIEPSQEFGYRDLETTQRLRKRKIDPNFAYSAADLRLPMRLYRLRKRGANRAKLNVVASDIAKGKCGRAAALLHRLEAN